MLDPCVGDMDTVKAAAMKTEAQFDVFVIALEVFAKESTACFDGFHSSQHCASAWSEHLFTGGKRSGWLSMSSAIAPATDGIALARGIQKIRLVMPDDRRHDTATSGIIKQGPEAGRKPSRFNDRVGIEHADHLS